MADRAKHAHGSRKNLEAAIANHAVDAFDVLFLSGEEENPAIGWLDKNGNPIIISPTDDLEKVEASFGDELAKKADVADVTKLGEEVDTKVDAATVKSMIDEYSNSRIEVIEF